jgi:hypothetical protein
MVLSMDLSPFHQARTVPESQVQDFLAMQPTLIR